MTGDESGLVENTVTVSGVPFFDGALAPDKVVTDTDTAQVLVIEPGISITKTASATGVRAGRDVTYTFAVTNTGDVGLTDVVPVDDKCAPLVRTGGDDGNEHPRRSQHRRARRPGPTPAPGRSGLPEPPDDHGREHRQRHRGGPAGQHLRRPTTPRRSRSSTRRIHLEKSVSDDLVLSGSTVDYTFARDQRRAEPGRRRTTSWTRHPARRDPAQQPGRAGVPVLVAKEGGNQDDFLEREPAETWRYTCQGTITRRTVDLAAVRALGGSTIDDRVPVDRLRHRAGHAVPPRHRGRQDRRARPAVGRRRGDLHLPGPQHRRRPARRRGGPDHRRHLLAGDLRLRRPATATACSTRPNSIFEDALDETWVFTCTTFVDEDTMNTVVVEGTPVDPGGEPLCDDARRPDAPLQHHLRAHGPRPRPRHRHA